MVLRDQRIDLRRSDARVPEEFLNDTHIRSTFEQVCRERMPQRMRCHSLVYPDRSGACHNDPTDRLPNQSSSRSEIEQERSAAPCGGHRRAPAGQICRHCFAPEPPERNLPFLAAFTKHTHSARFQIHIVHVEPDKLTHP